MVVPPGPWLIEVALPDTRLGPLRLGLLATIVTRRDRQALGHHFRRDVAVVDGAARQQAAVAVGIVGLAADWPGSQQLRQPVSRRAAAGPVQAGRVGAGLRQLGRVKAQETNALLAQDKTVAIADPPAPRLGRRRRIEPGGDDGEAGK